LDGTELRRLNETIIIRYKNWQGQLDSD